MDVEVCQPFSVDRGLTYNVGKQLVQIVVVKRVRKSSKKKKKSQKETGKGS